MPAADTQTVTVEKRAYTLAVPQYQSGWLSDPLLAGRRPDFISMHIKENATVVVYRWQLAGYQVVLEAAAQIVARHPHKAQFAVSGAITRFRQPQVVANSGDVASRIVWRQNEDGLPLLIRQVYRQYTQVEDWLKGIPENRL